MANEVPASVSMPLPRPQAPKERPSFVAGRDPSPEERHGTIGAARNPLVPPAGSAESRLDDAAREALANAAVEGALGIMTYGKSAAKLVAPNVLKRFSRAHPNASAHALRRETGYQRGLFGYGVETHGDATLKPRAVWNLGPQEGTLGELAYVSREIDVAYPGMSDTPLSIIPDSEWKPYLDTMRADLPPWAYTSNGFAAPDGGVVLRGIRPGETMETYASRADATLNHELQHIAQTADGLRPPYPHPDRDAYMCDAREVDARNTADRHVFTPADRDLFLRGATQDTPAELVNLDDKGGDNYGSFRNFLATDDVPESIFGIPVVQDESRYTEADIRFFKENPKAAGFYDMGDEEEVGAQEAWGGGSPLMFAMAAGQVGAQNEGRPDVLKGLAKFKQMNGNRMLSDTTVTDAVARDLLRRTGWQFGYAPGEIATEITDPDVNPRLPFRDLFLSDDARKEQQYKVVKSAAPGSAAYRRKLALELRQTAPGQHAYDEQHHRYARLLSAARTIADRPQVWALSDFLDFNHGGGDRLRKMYPGITDVNVRVERAPAGTKASGYYQRGKGVVLYDTAVVRAAQDPSLLRDLLVHETQHIVQEREHWVSGGSVDRASSEAEYRRYFGEIGAYNTQRRIHDKPGLFWDTAGYKPSEGLMPPESKRKGQ